MKRAGIVPRSGIDGGNPSGIHWNRKETPLWAETAHHNFRLGAGDPQTDPDAIKERSGLSSKPEVIRMAVRHRMFIETTKA